MRYLVDGMNLIESRPDGWWRDRPAARRALVEQLGALAGESGVTVVFDGRPTTGESEAAAAVGVTVRFAPGGPGAADDVIADAVASDAEPASLVVVTSDSGLVRRVQDAGAQVMAVRRFRSLIDR